MDCFLCLDQVSDQVSDQVGDQVANLALTRCCYQPICDQCQADFNQSASRVCACGDYFRLFGDDDNDGDPDCVKATKLADFIKLLEATKQANLDQLALAEAFYQEWSPRHQSRHQSEQISSIRRFKRFWDPDHYNPILSYQSELKSFSLARERLDRLSDLTHRPLFCLTLQQHLPNYSFQTPGIILLSLSGNRVLSNDNYFQYILTRPELTQNKKCMASLSANPRITMTMVRSHPELAWSYYDLSRNPNLTWTEVEADFVDETHSPTKPWSLANLSRVLSWSDIEANWHRVPNREWDGYELSQNPNTTINHVLDHPEVDWNWRWLSQHPNMTWSIIQDHPELGWQYNYVSANPNLTFDIVQDNPEYKWSYYGLARNPNIDWDFITANPQLDWDTSAYGYNPNLTYEVISGQKNTAGVQFLPHWYIISKNPAVTWQMVRDNRWCFWNNQGFSENPNVNWVIVDTHRDIWSGLEWDYERLCQNPMNRELWSW